MAKTNHVKSAILITYKNEDALNEAVTLCDAAQYNIQHIIKQDYLHRPKYGISEEIIDRLEEIAQKTKPDVIIYDEVLKPSQNYNLASKLGRNILDRESLILEIFESRASSTESKLQVKLGQMRYELTRAREKVRLSKMGEQPGFMGIGKFEADAYQDDIRHRMQTVKKKLAKAGKQRDLHRKSRKRQGFKTVSLAGYTSAGKTTLFNAMTGECREQSATLFTTLSTTIRRLGTEETFLMSDTVGFISKLPAYLIDAFKSTLEELLYSDVVIAVIDINDSLTDLKKKFRSCTKTLDEIGVQQNRLVYALNKSDLVMQADIEKKMSVLGLDKSKKCIAVSAQNTENLDALKTLIINIADNQDPDTTHAKYRESRRGYEY